MHPETYEIELSYPENTGQCCGEDQKECQDKESEKGINRCSCLSYPGTLCPA